MKRTVVLRGGPLDGHMREVEQGTRTAYFPYPGVSAADRARHGIRAAARGVVLVLVYEQVSAGMPIWKYIGVNGGPLGNAEA